MLNPAARSSAPDARAAAVTAAAPEVASPAIAAPADMKVGNGVSGAARRATSPPSWSIGIMTGTPRSAPAARIWSLKSVTDRQRIGGGDVEDAIAR